MGPQRAIAIVAALLAGKEAKPIPAGAVRIDLVIMTPRSSPVEARVWKGRIGIKGVDAGAELTAALAVTPEEEEDRIGQTDNRAQAVHVKIEDREEDSR